MKPTWPNGMAGAGVRRPRPAGRPIADHRRSQARKIASLRAMLYWVRGNRNKWKAEAIRLRALLLKTKKEHK